MQMNTSNTGCVYKMWLCSLRACLSSDQLTTSCCIHEHLKQAEATMLKSIRKDKHRQQVQVLSLHNSITGTGLILEKYVVSSQRKTGRKTLLLYGRKKGMVLKIKEKKKYISVVALGLTDLVLQTNTANIFFCCKKQKKNTKIQNK